MPTTNTAAGNTTAKPVVTYHETLDTVVDSSTANTACLEVVAKFTYDAALDDDERARVNEKLVETFDKHRQRRRMPKDEYTTSTRLLGLRRRERQAAKATSNRSLTAVIAGTATALLAITALLLPRDSSWMAWVAGPGILAGFIAGVALFQSDRRNAQRGTDDR